MMDWFNSWGAAYACSGVRCRPRTHRNDAPFRNVWAIQVSTTFICLPSRKREPYHRIYSFKSRGLDLKFLCARIA